MKLTSQEEFGLRLLLRLGRDEAQSLALSELARLEGISVPNAAKMMRALRRGGLVRSLRGKEGGYVLARPASQIPVGEALAVLGGRFYDARFCDKHAGAAEQCTNLTDCSIRSVWSLIQDAIDSVLGRMTLGDLIGGEPPLRGVSPRAVPLRMARIS
jgi:Rrf2 family transcriptional regulator, iron-sulfur cluster assembly transcription factor